MRSVAKLDLSRVEISDRLLVAKAIASNHRSAGRQLFVDISELVQRDAKSGIQRVVRSVLRVMLDTPPPGFHIVPVYATVDQEGYRKATRFTQSFLGAQVVEGLRDDPILFGPGDIYLGIDLHPQIVKAQRNYFKQMRARGVSVQFVVYDMLCVTMPQHFVPGSDDAFAEWIKIVSENDGAICISKAVAEELRIWHNQHCATADNHFEIGYFHLGADIRGSQPSQGLAAAEQQLLTQIGQKNNFLMVGTLEPRKGHAFALSAFEALWREGVNANLIIVGKKGWMVDGLAARLEQHPQAGKQLFWVQGASDELLEKIYALSHCLLVPSEGEGFGLPLIEAAHHQLPIIARDLPVFKEVAGEYAYYFSGPSPQVLSEAIKRWLKLSETQSHPSSAGMPCLTWQQSTQQLLACLIKQASH
jgi:glycosyltransferase involved in cell wall biosynthesis